MRKARPAIGAALITLASFLALSCNNNYGIFADIQGQKAQDGSKIFQKTPAYAAFMLGGNYYASTARLNRRGTTAGSAWSQVNIGGSASYLLRSVVLVGDSLTGKIYALLGADSSSVALYSSTDGDNWTAIAITGTGAGKTLDALYTANNELFAAGHLFTPGSGTAAGTSVYDLYHLNGLSFEPVANFTGLTTTIRGVAHNGAGTYWFAAEDRIYSASNPDGSGSITDLTTALTGLSGNLIWAVSYTGSPGHLYVSTQNGYLYQDTGTALQVNSNSLPLTEVVSVPSSGGPIILVGTDTKDINETAIGYYEGTYGALNVGSTNSIVASTSSIYNTTVSTFPVHSFFWDSVSANLFICISPGPNNTSFYGLYMSHWDSSTSSWAGWSAE